jgi:hypothetical protein
MRFFSGIGDLLKEYSGSSTNAASTAGVEQHFDQVAQAVPSTTIASGLAEAFRSPQTAPFPEMAAQLFGEIASNKQGF